MFWNKKEIIEQKEILPTTRHYDSPQKKSRQEVIGDVMGKSFTVPPATNSGATMDFFTQNLTLGNNFGESISDQHITYFGSHSFIGYQSCAILAQHWLVDHACSIPVNDALRKGWKLTRNDGEDLDAKEMAEITKLDKKLGIMQKANEFAKLGRVYGIRVAVFNIESDDPEFSELPLNLDGIKPGSYKGVIMNDPYYTIPLLGDRGQDPRSPTFYDPEYWVISGKKYHRSHCVVFRHSEVAQILKPSYIYGGVSMPQQIYEAVYNAEITATEIPQLIQNMRRYVYKVNLDQALMNPIELQNRLGAITQVSDNYGIQLIGVNDSLEHLQTTLTGLDDLVLGRYKIVAIVAQIPVAKLLKTDLTGGLVKGGGKNLSIMKPLNHCKVGSCHSLKCTIGCCHFQNLAVKK